MGIVDSFLPIILLSPKLTKSKLFRIVLMPQTSRDQMLRLETEFEETVVPNEISNTSDMYA